MKTKKMISLTLKRKDEVVFSTPVGSPDVVVGLLSTLAVPTNGDLSIDIRLADIPILDCSNEEKDD